MDRTERQPASASLTTGTPAGGLAASASPSSAIVRLAMPPAGQASFWLRMRAGFAFALWLLPGFVAGSSVGLYVLGQSVVTSDPAVDTSLVQGVPDGVVYTLGGAVIGLLLWAFISWLSGRYCTATIANADEFHKLAGRLSAIDAVLSTVPPPLETEAQKLISREQAIRDRDRAVAWLSWDGADQQWAFGDLYVAAWRYVHSAEEALVDILPVPVVMADAQMSTLRLNGSAIGDKATLNEQVTNAMQALVPAADASDRADGTGSAASDQGQPGESADRGDAASQAGAGTSATSRGVQVADVPVDEAGPRATIRAVKAAINDFRDGRSDQLVSLGRKVRIRHVALSIIVALLFEIGILALDPQYRLVEAFAVYFLVGALAGIALEAQRSRSAGPTSAQDYGINRERLFLTFSMSGAAACGGIILFVMLLGTTISDLFSSAPEAFAPEVVAVSPVLILVAAAFGLAPSRLFTAVTGLSEQIMLQSELSTSTPTGGPAGDGAGSSSGGDHGSS